MSFVFITFICYKKNHLRDINTTNSISLKVKPKIKLPLKQLMTSPYLIHFDQIGDSSVGYITVSEFEKEVPFPIKRVFWTYKTPKKITRGNHANLINKEVLIAVQGEIKVTTINSIGERNTFTLNNPNEGIYLPPNIWLTIEYSDDAIQLVLASEKYNEKDYIRNYQEFTS
jgi:hypothetical protein